MKSRAFLVVSLLVLCSGHSAAQSDADYKVLRTEYGQPDLQGVWNFSSNTPLQRPEAFGDRAYMTQEEARERQTRTVAATEQGSQSADGVGGYNTFWFEMAGRGDNLRTSLITYPENGRLPAIAEGAPYQVGGLGDDVPSQRPVRFSVGGISKDGPEDRGLSERCIVGFNAGPPFLPSGYNNNLQIIQHRNYVVIMTEMVHDARIVPLDSNTELHDSIRLWSGDSRGYWDGETLVVESKNFTDYTQSLPPFGAADYGTAYHKTLTERFTRVDPYTINYEFTLEDPATFSDKIVAMVPMAKVDGLMYEYACHEGNYGMLNMLRGARMEERGIATND
ncbi:MAG: hypothetical protein O2971_07210 [Proteobacteria bacterium]|nr:hypothetical protein [Pseudomonadota bacterium]